MFREKSNLLQGEFQVTNFVEQVGALASVMFTASRDSWVNLTPLSERLVVVQCVEANLVFDEGDYFLSCEYSHFIPFGVRGRE
jgi:hypothetical protein